MSRLQAEGRHRRALLRTTASGLTSALERITTAFVRDIVGSNVRPHSTWWRIECRNEAKPAVVGGHRVDVPAAKSEIHQPVDRFPVQAISTERNFEVLSRDNLMARHASVLTPSEGPVIQK